MSKKIISQLDSNTDIRFPHLIKNTFFGIIIDAHCEAMRRCYCLEDGTYIMDTEEIQTYLLPQYMTSLLTDFDLICETFTEKLKKDLNLDLEFNLTGKSLGRDFFAIYATDSYNYGRSGIKLRWLKQINKFCELAGIRLGNYTPSWIDEPIVFQLENN